jgi:transcriptional regulator with XRE-family HTH domain
MNSEEFSRRRKALDITQVELGRLWDVPQNTISRWELGKGKMQRPRMLDLAFRALEYDRLLRYALGEANGRVPAEADTEADFAS